SGWERRGAGAGGRDERPAVRAGDDLRGHVGHPAAPGRRAGREERRRERGPAGHREGQPGSTDVGEPAREQATDGGEPGEGEEPEADDTAAKLVRCGQL